MAWEWSHTNEGMSNACANLYVQSREFLEIALAEIRATPKDEHGCWNESSFDLELYAAAEKDVKEIPTDLMADEIWRFAEEFKTCDNGGHRAWMCPHGCHTVSFSDEGNPYPE